MGILLCILLAAHPTKVALMPLNNGEGVNAGVAASVTDAVASEIRRRGVTLVTEKEITAILGLERQKALMGCGNDQCLAELGGALGVDQMVTGSVAQLGSSYLVHLQLVDATKATVVAQSDRRKKGGSLDDVLDELPAMVGELFGGTSALAVTPAPPPVPGPKASATKAPAPWADIPTDLGADRAKLRLLTDGHGHYLATVPFGGGDAPLLSGDASTLYLQRVFGRSSQGDTQFSLNFWEPRAHSPSDAELVFRDQAYHLFCGKTDVPFTLVPDAEAARLLGKLKLNGGRWQRHGYAIARDDEGTYFYVDQALQPEDNTDFHLFVGKKGALAYVPVTSADRDSDADLFTTAQGTLKFPRALTGSDGKPLPAEWIVAGARRPLSHLDVRNSARMIYTELGVYSGESLGTPCDGHF